MRLCNVLRGCLIGVLTVGAVVWQGVSASAQDNASAATESQAAILNKFVEVNGAWLNPKPARLSYVVTGTVKEEQYVNRVWIDGPDLRWEMDRKGENPFEYAIVVGGDSAVYVKGPERLLKKQGPAGDIRAFRQGITWRTAVHAIQQQGVPDDAKVIDRKKGDRGETVVVEMSFPFRPMSVPDQRLNVGLGLRHTWLGQTQRPMGKVRLHLRLPEYFPVLEEYLDRNDQVQYGDEPIRLGDSLAPSSITYVGALNDGRKWELAAHFKKHDSVWLLERAENRLDGKVVTTLNVSDVSTAVADKELFVVPAR